jgi:hypothetical protein
VGVYGGLGIKNGGEWVSDCREFEVAGAKSRGKGRKTWFECVKNKLR